MLEQLKEKVFQANQQLVQKQLVILTWGNASAFDPESGYAVIKPSGVAYDLMTANDMIVVDLDGIVIEGRFKPSSDTPTHLALYKHWKGICGIVHTHSLHATAWAQSGLDLTIQGTTHADYFYGDIPCIPSLNIEETEQAYEHYTGMSIISEFKKRNLDPLNMGACLLSGHGPFSWSKSVEKAVENSVVLETIAQMGFLCASLNPHARLPQYILDKHFLRKHGPNAYYGQH
ncbi:MAG: L-ribulose-5-phosphate 4-epimerase AraD [Brevinema sp.]